MFFSFAEGFTDAFLFRDMAIQFLDVLARLFGLCCGAVDVLHVGPVSEIDNRDDWDRRHESKKAYVSDEARDDRGGRRAGKICNRSPQKIFAPGEPDRGPGL